MWVPEGMCSSLVLDKQGLDETPVIKTKCEKQDITSQAVADGQHSRGKGLQIGKERKMQWVKLAQKQMSNTKAAWT